MSQGQQTEERRGSSAAATTASQTLTSLTPPPHTHTHNTALHCTRSAAAEQALSRSAWREEVCVTVNACARGRGFSASVRAVAKSGRGVVEERCQEVGQWLTSFTMDLTRAHVPALWTAFFWCLCTGKYRTTIGFRRYTFPSMLASFVIQCDTVVLHRVGVNTICVLRERSCQQRSLGSSLE